MLGILWFIMKAVFIFFLITTVIHSLITHFMLWIELRLQSLQGQLPERIPVINLLKSILVEWFCNFARFFISPFQFLSSVPLNSLKNTGTPILLVHGYLQNQTDWIWFKHCLKEIPDIGPIYSFNLQSRFGSIAKYAEQLKQEVAHVQAETKQEKVILIGHSMGGLVCSYFSEFMAKPGEVAKVITLASPFQGTRLAALGYGENVQEMSPHSSFLQDLTTRMRQSGIAYHHVASQLDNMIIPWKSALPINNNIARQNVFILEDHGHLRLLISPLVVRQVAQWILEIPAYPLNIEVAQHH